MNTFAKVLWILFGILMIISGIIALFNPLNTLIMLAYIIGFLMILSGVSALFYFADIRGSTGASWVLLNGIISVIFGIIILANIQITGAFIPFLAAFWAIFQGIISIVSSFDMKKVGVNRWYLMLIGGIISLIIGIILTFHPVLAALVVSVMVGIALIFYGILTIGFCLSFKKS